MSSFSTVGHLGFSGFLAAVALPVGGLMATSTQASGVTHEHAAPSRMTSAAEPITHGDITVTNLGLNSKDRFRYKVKKTASAPDLIKVIEYKGGAEVKKRSQTKSSQTHTGSKVRDGESIKLTIGVHDPSGPEELFYEHYWVPNYKKLKKSCSKTHPLVEVTSKHTPKSVFIRVSSKNADGKTVNESKPVEMFRISRDGEKAAYTAELKKGQKAVKMVAKAGGLKSIRCY